MNPDRRRPHLWEEFVLILYARGWDDDQDEPSVGSHTLIYRARDSIEPNAR
jgi:hypothetical protein